MGSSPDAKLGWGIDLGSDEDWGSGKYAALGQRFLAADEDENDEDPERPGSFSDWESDVLPGLYVDNAARKAELDAHTSKADEMIAAGRRADYVAQRAEIMARFLVPVSVVTYGYEFRSHALILERSYAWAYDYGSVDVTPDQVAPPTPEEVGHLKTAVESLGLEFEPETVRLVLMSQYG